MGSGRRKRRPRRGGSRFAPGRPRGGGRWEAGLAVRGRRRRGPGVVGLRRPSERAPAAGRPLGRLPARPRGHRFPGRGWEPNGGAGSGQLSLGAGGRREGALLGGSGARCGPGLCAGTELELSRLFIAPCRLFLRLQVEERKDLMNSRPIEMGRRRKQQQGA